jgi:hypothetical protein
MIQKLVHQQQQTVDDFETEIEDYKTELGPRVLKMTMGDLRLSIDFNDLAKLDKTMNKLNQTVKDTMQKADEGNLILINNSTNTSINWCVGYHSKLKQVTNNSHSIYHIYTYPPFFVFCVCFFPLFFT